MKHLAIALTLAAAGCSHAPYWERVEGWKLIGEPRVHYLDRMPWPGAIEGYARRNKDGTCDIYVLKSAQNHDCVVAHERRHCEGWDHPKYRVNFACYYAPIGGRL